MPRVNAYPTLVPVPGGQIIMEHVGRVSTGDDSVSLAHLTVSGSWQENWRTPEYRECVLVMKGTLVIEHDRGMLNASAGQSVVIPAGTRLRHSCGPTGTEYISVCTPAYSAETAHIED